MALMIKRVVVAIGGNALIKDNEHLEISDQLKSAQETAAYIADFIAINYHCEIEVQSYTNEDSRFCGSGAFEDQNLFHEN